MEASTRPYTTASGIDPRNAFANETEFYDYNSDYGAIVPAIYIKGCEIPVKPNRAEKRGIRYYFNVAGTCMLAHSVLVQFLMTVLVMVFYVAVETLDYEKSGGELPALYDDMLYTYLCNGAAYIAMLLIVYLFCNVGFTLFGLKLTKTPLSSLFQTRDYSVSLAIKYGFIAIGLQCLTGYVAYYISALLESGGVSTYEADFTTTTDFKCVLLMGLYTCIVAPITEELFYRGLVLKCTSRVSQRFGIITSALFFGLGHENLSQFVLAFAVGIFFAYLTVKHNSIVPSIVAHMVVNGISEVFDLVDLFGTAALYDILDWIYLLVAIVGVIQWIIFLCKERMPISNAHQRERGLRLALTSIPLVLAAAFHIVMAIYYCIEE